MVCLAFDGMVKRKLDNTLDLVGDAGIEKVWKVGIPIIGFGGKCNKYCRDILSAERSVFAGGEAMSI